jgi:hypothetical protein
VYPRRDQTGSPRSCTLDGSSHDQLIHGTRTIWDRSFQLAASGSDTTTPRVSAQEGEAPEPAPPFNSTLRAPAAATDVWGVLCPIGTSTLRCRVADTGGVDSVRFGVCCENKHGPASQCLTAPDGGASALAFASPGPGEYEAKVFKVNPVGNAPGPEPYQVNLDCLNAGGGAIATFVVLIQNQ